MRSAVCRGYGALTFAHLFTHVFPLAESGYLVAASQYRGVDPSAPAEMGVDEFGESGDLGALYTAHQLTPGHIVNAALIAMSLDRRTS